MYRGGVSCLLVVWYLIMPHIRYVYVLQPLIRPHVRHVYMLLPLVRPYVRHICMLLPLVMLHVRYVHLDLHTALILKGRTTHIWSFGCVFACATTMGCAGFNLSFGIIIVL